MANTYVLRGENGKFIPTFKEGGFASLGWFSSDCGFDLEKSNSRTYIKEKIYETKPDYSSRGLGLATGMVYRFIHEMKIGDSIITPATDGKVLIGKVLSEAYMGEDENIGICGRIRKKIEWADEIDKNLLSDEVRRKLYCNLTFFSVDEPVDQIIEDEDIVEEINEIINVEDKSSGFSYFMESIMIPGIYKLGKADNVESRESGLRKCNRYGVFNLKTKAWVKVNNPLQFEKMLHLYFQKYRMDSKNGLEVDTELFKTDFDLFELWKNFIVFNYLNNPIMKNEILDYKF
jgi:hypothetical protein